MNFDLFALPFVTGFLIMMIMLLWRYVSWVKKLPGDDRHLLGKAMLTTKPLYALKEIFMESLLHRRIFRVNGMLGFMHMSLAFGWFLLIVMGTIESKMYSGRAFSKPYNPIFFNYLVHDKGSMPIAGFFSFAMDFLLLYILSAVTLAWVKRFYSRLFGMKKSTHHKPMDRLALTTLWLIFPLRLVAESFTSGIYHNGDFLTDTMGRFLAPILPLHSLEEGAWWAYSWSLGLFFVALPYSRYMHIPTEILLIFLRRMGVSSDEKLRTSFSQVEIHSCPSCGICIDKCQLSDLIPYAPSVYFLSSLRNNNTNTLAMDSCLMCGRCKEFCPVVINTTGLRMQERVMLRGVDKEVNDCIEASIGVSVGNNYKVGVDVCNGKSISNDYSYLPSHEQKEADVVYFAGCMSHLTPTIKRSMISILDYSGVSYQLLDREASVCCGRPLMLAGKIREAKQLIQYNKKQIVSSGAKVLVTSCPICYRIFKEEYNLNMEVLHHSQFLLQLIDKGQIILNKQDLNVVYHDPCELGRGSGIYREPRELIGKVATLQNTLFEKENSLCCGGSLAGLNLSGDQRNTVSHNVVEQLCISHPQFIVTSCPLCKKTLVQEAPVPVMDVAEIVVQSLQSKKYAIKKDDIKKSATINYINNRCAVRI